MVGKPVEEIKLRKLMKLKLQTANIPDLEFEDCEGNLFKFSEFYDYHKFLGCGSFGFVVSAIDKATGEHLALKVIKLFYLNFMSRLWMLLMKVKFLASKKRQKFFRV